MDIHVAKYEQIGGIHVINPGSISQSRSQIEETLPNSYTRKMKIPSF